MWWNSTSEECHLLLCPSEIWWQWGVLERAGTYHQIGLCLNVSHNGYELRGLRKFTLIFWVSWVLLRYSEVRKGYPYLSEFTLRSNSLAHSRCSVIVLTLLHIYSTGIVSRSFPWHRRPSHCDPASSGYTPPSPCCVPCSGYSKHPSFPRLTLPASSPNTYSRHSTGLLNAVFQFSTLLPDWLSTYGSLAILLMPFF